MRLVVVVLLVACQSGPPPPTITIIDNNQVITLQTSQRVPSTILTQAGITLNPSDRLLLNGIPIVPDQPITNYSITLQIRRAVPLTVLTPAGERQIQSSAFTVGEALTEASIWLRAGDEINPSLQSPVSGLQFSDSPISIYPSHPLAITADGKTLHTQSSAATVGQGLAEAGIPLLGLDISLPAANEALPADGQVKVVRVSESILLTQKPIPFESELVASADVPLDQTRILQPGENGLSVQRIRIRYEDGQEISRTTENETLVRQPKTRVLGYGTKIEIKTAVVDGVQIEYWRAVQLYATSFSPCRLGVAGLCSTTTASGLPLKKGIAGMKLSWYVAMKGQRFFIPGYGFAVLGDSGGGHPLGYPLIDLGYSDEDYVGWHQWVTVYFLTPVPANVIYVLE
jgi:uncharacterized protein YabE (DUF348 family)